MRSKNKAASAFFAVRTLLDRRSALAPGHGFDYLVRWSKATLGNRWVNETSLSAETLLHAQQIYWPAPSAHPLPVKRKAGLSLHSQKPINRKSRDRMRRVRAAASVKQEAGEPVVPPKLPAGLMLGTVQHGRQVHESLIREIRERDAAAAKLHDSFARLPDKAQLYESVLRFRELTDCFQARPVCATCGVFTEPDHCERFSLNPERPMAATRELPEVVLERMKKYCVGKSNVWMQSATNPTRPGLARLDKILLQWRYWADDYSQLHPAGVDEETETLILCGACYKHLNAKRCRKAPKFSLANGLQFDQVPREFLQLTIAEWHVIRPFRVVASILELHMEDPMILRTHADQLKLRGNVVAFPQNALSLVKSWPVTPDDLADTMHVVLLNPHDVVPDEISLGKLLACNRKRIRAALECLAKSSKFLQVRICVPRVLAVVY